MNWVSQAEVEQCQEDEERTYVMYWQAAVLQHQVAPVQAPDTGPPKTQSMIAW